MESSETQLHRIPEIFGFSGEIGRKVLNFWTVEWKEDDGSMQTLQKPKEAEQESRKSSKCHPGSISVRYSDMLLVRPFPGFAATGSELLLLFPSLLLGNTAGEATEAAAFVEFGSGGGGGGICWEDEEETETGRFWTEDDSARMSGTVSKPREAVGFAEEAYRFEVAESLMPVRRKRLCFRVCSLTVWIGTSHSLQRIALSC